MALTDLLINDGCAVELPQRACDAPPQVGEHHPRLHPAASGLGLLTGTSRVWEGVDRYV